MSTTATKYEHIIFNEDKQLVIKGTRFKIIDIVLDKIAYGWSPEEIQHQHPELTLGQIYSALAYYTDHQDEFEIEIEQQLKQIELLKNELSPPTLIKKLKDKKLI